MKNTGIFRKVIFISISAKALIGLFMIIMVACSKGPAPYYIVGFKGTEQMENYSNSFFPNDYKADSFYINTVLAQTGDIFITESGGAFIFRDPEQKNYTLKSVKEYSYLNGKLFSVTTPFKDSLFTVFETLKENDISSLEFINFGDKISEKYYPDLERIAKIKPDIGICYNGDLRDMERLFKIFKPKLLAGMSLSQADYNTLTLVPDLEGLIVTLRDTVFNEPLPPMPSLKTLMIIDSEKGFPTKNFLVNNGQIERLNIMMAHKFDLSVFSPEADLKHLIVNNFDTIENIDLIKNLKKLEEVGLTGENFRFGPELNELKNLRRIALPLATLPEDLNTIIKYHPNLEILDILTTDTIRNLQPLQNLKSLYGLTVTGNHIDIESIKTLKNLKYLALPNNVLKDSLVKADLQNALPGTKLVPREGPCLGSGWILLLIPLVLIFMFLSKIKVRGTIN